MNARLTMPLFVIAAAICIKATAQNSYHYSVDLTKVNNDELKVELVTPEVTEQEIVFHMPKIVPAPI